MQSNSRISLLVRVFHIAYVVLGLGMAVFLLLDPLKLQQAASPEFTRIMFYAFLAICAAELVAMRVVAAYIRKQLAAGSAQVSEAQGVIAPAAVGLSVLVYAFFYRFMGGTAKEAMILWAFIIPAYVNFMLLAQEPGQEQIPGGPVSSY